MVGGFLKKMGEKKEKKKKKNPGGGEREKIFFGFSHFF